MTADLSDSLKDAEKRVKKWPEAGAIFFKADGTFYKPGDRLVQRNLAATLQRIADRGPDGFYKGRTAQAIVTAVEAFGGRITIEDMAGYRAIERDPVTGTYRWYDIVSMPPPSSGGIHII